jgi:predicted ribosomally synthesized peptide with nif11-like leader
MSLKPETIAQIQTMLQADPALLAQVQSLSQPNDAADAIAKAASAKGIEVSAAEMAAHFESAAPQGAMSDAELEQVAGGRTPWQNPFRWSMMGEWRSVCD